MSHLLKKKEINFVIKRTGAPNMKPKKKDQLRTSLNDRIEPLIFGLLLLNLLVLRVLPIPRD